jgi:hypothetical protein
VEQHPFGAPQAVGQPRSEHRGQVDQAAVGADDAGGGRLVDAEAALGGAVVQVDQQDPLHAVEREPFPQLDTEQVGQRGWLAEERPLAAGG